MRDNYKPFLATLAIGLVALAVPSVSFALPFFDFHGYSYRDGPPDEVGTRLFVPTVLNPIQPDPIWPLDFDANEYTVYVEDLEIADIDWSGPVTVYTFSGGTVALYRDPSKNSAWAPYPPNSQVPASFEDGVIELSGHFTGMVMVYDPNAGTGTISGLIDWTGGDKLGELQNPSGWTYFGGVSNHSGLGIPAGYDLAWDPQIYGPEPANPIRSGSWGRIKQHFRTDTRSGY